MINAADVLNANILIVDDLETNVLLLSKMLAGAGYTQVNCTMNPQEVCTLHQQHRYDLILLDLQMPGMDGFQVMDGLKEIESDAYLPILVITAQPGHRMLALKSGAKDFISKPFDLFDAKMRIHNMLEARLLYKQLKHSNHALESLALHDTLTGLPNRQLFMDRLLLAMCHARRNKGTVATLCLDLDDFEHINETLGRDVGDTLLSLVAARLVAAVRQEDTVARLEGDRFAIAFWELGHAEGVAKVASKIIQTVAQPYSVAGRGIQITASVGVGSYPWNGTAVESLMESAELALQEAKHAGKNGYRVAARTELLAVA